MTTNQPNNRLEQIEAILLQTAQQQQTNTIAIAELRSTVTENARAITELRSAIAENTRNITDNKETIDALIETVSVMVSEEDSFQDRTNRSIEQLTENVNRLITEGAEYRQLAAADRQQAAIDRQQAANNHQVTLVEIQRIWQYLLDRNPGNGRTGE